MIFLVMLEHFKNLSNKNLVFLLTIDELNINFQVVCVDSDLTNLILKGSKFLWEYSYIILKIR